QAQDRELRRLAVDIARDAVDQLAGLSAAQARAELERIARDAEAYLRSPRAQRESGQREQTTERLDLTDRIFVDGKAETIAIDRERRLQDVVRKVTTDDAIRRDRDVERLGVNARELEKIAREKLTSRRKRCRPIVNSGGLSP